MTKRENVYSVWKKILKDFKEDYEISPNVSFELSRRVISAFLEDQVVTLGFPNGFALEWFEKRYPKQIEALFKKYLGDDVLLDTAITQIEGTQEPFPKDSLFANTQPTFSNSNEVNSRDKELEPLDFQPPSMPMVDNILPHPQVRANVALPTSVVRGNAHPLIRLNPKFTFDTFVVGSHSRLAHAASLAVAEAPGSAYNPLFLYGGVGLGKTHLMHAIANALLQRHPQMPVMFVSSEVFTNELIEAIRQGQTQAFRKRYRANEVLLIDDVQFVAGKESTQNEFFHTFNTLYEAGKQVVISSDRPPHEFVTLESRLRSRFAAGLIADIQSPDFETRNAILRSKVAFLGIDILEDVLTVIALKVTSNVRELEGALMRVITQSRIKGQPLDADFTEKELDQIYTQQPIISSVKTSSLQSILQETAKYFGIEEQKIRGKTRKQNIVLARQVAMYLMREHTEASFNQVGEEFGGRDHTTVMHGVDKIKNLLSYQGDIREAVEKIQANVFRR